jgi:hypothetical protein
MVELFANFRYDSQFFSLRGSRDDAYKTIDEIQNEV